MQIPVEIKSPTEERELSTKSVRQALENKIISIARGGLAARKDITSLIVGFSIPTERSDMAQLIEDIHVAYGFAIGVISITTLAKLALVAMTTKQVVDAEQLIRLKGFLDG